MLLGILKGICPFLSGLGVVLLGILKGMDPMGPGVVLLVNLYGTCPEVPLGVRMLGVNPGGGAVPDGSDTGDWDIPGGEGVGGIPDICAE